MAEVLLDATSQVAARADAVQGLSAGTRALQLPDSNVESYFLRSFGRPDRVTRASASGPRCRAWRQALHLSNGDTVNQKLSAKENRIDQLIAEKAPDEKIVEDAYLSALSRYPTAQEKKELLAALAGAKENKREVIEDLYWSVLSSRGFCLIIETEESPALRAAAKRGTGKHVNLADISLRYCGSGSGTRCRAPSYADVHAVIAKNCLACHDSKEAEGGLVLETFELLMAGGTAGRRWCRGNRRRVCSSRSSNGRRSRSCHRRRRRRS